MDEIEQSPRDGEAAEKKVAPRLMGRAKCERWVIPRALRGPLINRLARIIHDQTSSNREVLAAVSAILAASKINLANIDLMIKVHEYEELKQRLDELEQMLDERTGGNRANR